MIRFAADEDFDNDIVRGLVRRVPAVDVRRVQDMELRGASDPLVLAWAATEQRVLLTHDVTTMCRRAMSRVERGEPIPHDPGSRPGRRRVVLRAAERPRSVSATVS